MLSITTAADLQLPAGRHQRNLWLMTGGGIFAAVILGGIPSRRRWAAIFGFTVFIALAVGVACGGGGGGSQGHGTPAGTYAITVTGTSGSITHNATVSFTVQ